MSDVTGTTGPQLLRATALTVLRNNCAASSRPVLSDDDLNTLLDTSGATDDQGTWWGDINAASAQGWSWKAGRVAGDFDFSADDARYSKGDVLAHCLAMEQTYASRAGGSLHAPRAPLSRNLVVNG